jgi:hypothetical protein
MVGIAVGMAADIAVAGTPATSGTANRALICRKSSASPWWAEPDVHTQRFAVRTGLQDQRY